MFDIKPSCRWNVEKQTSDIKILVKITIEETNIDYGWNKLFNN
jgi:hypothetical protein